MHFVPVTCDERAEMLAKAGVTSVEELFSDIPDEALLGRSLDLPDPMTEVELSAHIEALARRNSGAGRFVSFLGGGTYDHYIPKIVDAVASKPAFFTAYTPYQPEVSQGTLQAIYEFQSMVCALTGMEVANASMYDGGTAFTEAALMAARVTKRHRVVVSGAVHPEWLETLRTYVESGTLEVIEVPAVRGVSDTAAIAAAVDTTVAAVMVASPTFFGTLEDLAELSTLAHHAGALLVVGANPIMLGVMEPPASYGADIVVAEGQPLGNTMSYGGPGLGIFACNMQHVRQMPGRLVGRTTDVDGRTGFVLTFSTREQHIRRERATSNICSNHSLNALQAAVYMSAVGADGLAGIAEACIAKAHYLEAALVETGKFERVSDAPFGYEFTLRCKGDVTAFQDALLARGYLAGVALERFAPALNGLVSFAVTEKRTRAEIDAFVGEVSAL